MSTDTLAVSERSYDAEPRSHSHDFHQVLFPSLGRLSLGIGNEPGYVGSGRAAFVAAGVDHVYMADGPNRILVADMPAGQPEADPSADALAAVGPGAFLRLDPRLMAVAAALRAELHGGGLDDPLVADALGRYLKAALGRASESASSSRGASPASRRLARAVEELLRAHYAQPLSVTEIAAAVGASPAHLHRCFRDHTGTSIVTFVHELRLARAAELLRDSDLSVLEVAHAVGFASHSHLSRLFARRFGCPPGRYRAQAMHP